MVVAVSKMCAMGVGFKKKQKEKGIVVFLAPKQCIRDL